MFQYLLYKVGAFITNTLPLRLAYRFCLFCSDIHYAYSVADRRAVEANLKIILKTDRVPMAQVREVFRNFGRYLLEFFRFPKDLNRNFLEKNVELKNLHYIDEALKAGKGAIVLTGHMGNWELGGMLLPVMGYPILEVALPHKNRLVNNLFNGQREIAGAKVIANNIAFRRCVETLKANHLLAIVGDRDFTHNGEPIDFFGRRAIFPKGPAILSTKTGAPFVPAFCIRKPDSKFLFVFGKPIFPPAINEGFIEEKAILFLMEQYKNVIEEKISQYPTQWLMFREFAVQ